MAFYTPFFLVISEKVLTSIENLKSSYDAEIIIFILSKEAFKMLFATRVFKNGRQFFSEISRSRLKIPTRDNILKIFSRESEKRFFIKYLFSKNLFSISEKRFSKILSLFDLREEIF